MPWYRLADGTSAHLKIAGPRKIWPRNCQAPWDTDPAQWCSCMASIQCAWKLPGGKTCAKYLCEAHAFKVAEDKRLCPEHRAAYEVWLARKRAKVDG